MTRVRLIVRGDDAGSCDSANRAIIECCRHGVLSNVSIMVPGPKFEEAAAMLKDLPGVYLGLHVTLNAEWDSGKWGPVLPASQVPSLVDDSGRFLPTPMHLHERRASVDEMMAEVEAQLAQARAHGLQIAYLDEHMGVGWLPGFGERLAALCTRKGLIYAAPIPGLPITRFIGNPRGRWTADISRAAPGTYVLVTHPGTDAPDMQAFGTAGTQPGQIARERDADRRALLTPRLRDTWQALGVELISYKDV